jgi:hypothetical protein
VGAGMRMMLMQSGFVVSIALAIGLVTSAMDPQVMVAVFSGSQVGGEGIAMGSFINALRIAFLAGVGFSALGAVVSAMRGEHRSYEGAESTTAPPDRTRSEVAASGRAGR